MTADPVFHLASKAAGHRVGTAGKPDAAGGARNGRRGGQAEGDGEDVFLHDDYPVWSVWRKAAQCRRFQRDGTGRGGGVAGEGAQVRTVKRQAWRSPWRGSISARVAVVAGRVAGVAGQPGILHPAARLFEPRSQQGAPVQAAPEMLWQGGVAARTASGRSPISASARTMRWRWRRRALMQVG